MPDAAPIEANAASYSNCKITGNKTGLILLSSPYFHPQLLGHIEHELHVCFRPSLTLIVSLCSLQKARHAEKSAKTEPLSESLPLRSEAGTLFLSSHKCHCLFLPHIFNLFVTFSLFVFCSHIREVLNLTESYVNVF